MVKTASDKDNQIIGALKRKHPKATKVERNECGDYDVTIEWLPDGWHDEIMTYAFVNGRLRYIGSTEIMY